jgi:hypothetical protein
LSASSASEIAAKIALNPDDANLLSPSAIGERWLAAMSLASGRTLSSKRMAQPATIPSLVRAYFTRCQNSFAEIRMSCHPKIHGSFGDSGRMCCFANDAALSQFFQDHACSPVEFHGGRLLETWPTVHHTRTSAGSGGSLADEPAFTLLSPKRTLFVHFGAYWRTLKNGEHGLICR